MRHTKNRIFALAGMAALAITMVNGWGSSASLAASRAMPGRQSISIPLSGSWTIDPFHTNVNFAVKHFGISTVRGRFDEVAGTIVADEAVPSNSKVEVTIKTASIDTDVKMRDDHLRSPDFFDAAKYPEITFKSTRVERRSADNWAAHGILTMHGVSRQISVPFKVAGPVKDERAGARIGVEAKLRLNRQDYGIKYNQLLDNGILAVGNDVNIEIGLEAVTAK